MPIASWREHTWFTKIVFCVCMFVYMCVCLSTPTWKLYKPKKQPVYKEWRLYRACNKLIGWWTLVNTCRFEIWVERVCKDIVKAFLKGLCGRKIAEKQRSWPSKLPGKTSEKGACPIHTRTKFKTSFDSLSKKFA